MTATKVCSYFVLMSRIWNSLDELVNALAQRAVSGRSVVLSPETTLMVVQALTDASRRPGRSRLFNVDFWAEGSTIYRLTVDGQDEEVVGWAKNSLVARAALEELKRRYPNARFSQRRRAWVELEG